MAGERSEEGQDFTVVDKRERRASEGGGEPTAAGRPSPPRAEPPPAASQEIHEAPGITPDLTSLFLMLGTSAMIHLGAAPDPVTGQSLRDLGQARYTIDLLGLLKDKTEGHRSPEESQLLDDLLYDLRMRYLQESKL